MIATLAMAVAVTCHSQLTLAQSTSSTADTVTSSRPVLFAKGRRIAYISSPRHGQPGQVHVVDIAGTSDAIVAGTASAIDVEFSPDEKRILFRTLSLSRGGAPQSGVSDFPMRFIVADADGRNQITIASGKTLSSASWSPDGKQIAYTTRPGGRGVPSTIMIADADGSNARELSSGLSLVEPATWSRDGTLAYVVESAVGTQVMIADKRGGTPRAIAPAIAYQSTPTWSPDGKQLAFRGAEQPIGPGTLKHLYIANADGSGLHQVIADATGLLELRFSPDCSKIAYASSHNSTTKTSIYVRDVSGDDERQLTDVSSFNEDPSWTPDGKLIVFQSTRSGTSRVYVMTADGHDVRLIR